MAQRKDHNLENRRGTWHFVVKKKGRKIKLSLKTTSVTEARKLRDEMLRRHLNGEDLRGSEKPENRPVLFGEMAQRWAKITEKNARASTMVDYRVIMNGFVLPEFGNMALEEIKPVHIREFLSRLRCGNKRKNNILIPFRGVFKLACESDYISSNPFKKIKNLRVDKTEILPLSIDEVNTFLTVVTPWFRNFFAVAFYTGMRFGEMAALKWDRVDFKRGIIKVVETRVNGIESSPKTRKSFRDIDMIPLVIEALRDQRKETFGRSEYVFLNRQDKPVVPQTMNFHVWKPALEKAGLRPRAMYQTRHTFATLMLETGELPGWVQQMMGHETLAMIHNHYYTYIKHYNRRGGSAFMERVLKQTTGEGAIANAGGA